MLLACKDQFLECFKLPGLCHKFWFNSAFSGNEHCSFHSWNSCFWKLRALANLGSAARAALPVWDRSCDSAGTLSYPLAFTPAVFLQSGPSPNPSSPWSAPAHFSGLLCHRLQVLLNFLLPVSSAKLCCFLFTLSTLSLPLLSHSVHSCNCPLPGWTELFAVSLELSTPVLRTWGLMSARPC